MLHAIRVLAILVRMVVNVLIKVVMRNVNVAQVLVVNSVKQLVYQVKNLCFNIFK